MGVISLLWGIVALLWMILALIPLLGWGNWFLIPFAAVGAVIAAIGILLVHADTVASIVAIWWRSETFAHGFVVLSETCDFVYKCTAFYRPEAERAIAAAKQLPANAYSACLVSLASQLLERNH